MFKNLIYWPERKPIRSTMPWSFFTTFGNNVAVIIDCFEIMVIAAATSARPPTKTNTDPPGSFPVFRQANPALLTYYNR